MNDIVKFKYLEIKTFDFLSRKHRKKFEKYMRSFMQEAVNLQPSDYISFTAILDENKKVKGFVMELD